jgi:putative membrane protein insertion efficiency factor
MTGWLKTIWLLPRKALCQIIVFYQEFLSPLKPRCCRFEPTCSTSATEALMVHGVLVGGLLTVWRILRCHPFYHGPLYYPVPPKRNRDG